MMSVKAGTMPIPTIQESVDDPDSGPGLPVRYIYAKNITDRGVTLEVDYSGMKAGQFVRAISHGAPEGQEPYCQLHEVTEGQTLVAFNIPKRLFTPPNPNPYPMVFQCMLIENGVDINYSDHAIFIIA